jgi:hypothetical protein
LARNCSCKDSNHTCRNRRAPHLASRLWKKLNQPHTVSTLPSSIPIRIHLDTQLRPTWRCLESSQPRSIDKIRAGQIANNRMNTTYTYKSGSSSSSARRGPYRDYQSMISVRVSPQHNSRSYIAATNFAHRLLLRTSCAGSICNTVEQCLPIRTDCNLECLPPMQISARTAARRAALRRRAACFKDAGADPPMQSAARTWCRRRPARP